MEEQITALISALKPTVVVEPELVPEEGKDFEWPLFYGERRDAETVVYLHRETDKEQFVDHGSHIQIITTEPTEQAQSIKAALDLAADRGWREIEVTGNEEFRRQVWQEASLAGIQVRGYTPSPEDLAELEKLRPGSAPAPAESEPAAWKVEEQNGLVVVTGPDGIVTEFEDVDSILTSDDILPQGVILRAAEIQRQLDELEQPPGTTEPTIPTQEPARIAVTEDLGSQVTLTEEQERFRVTLFPNLAPAEYLAMEQKMRANYEALPEASQERIEATVERMGKALESNNDVGERLKQEAEKADLRQKARQVFGQNKALIESAKEREKEPSSGKALAAENSRDTRGR